MHLNAIDFTMRAAWEFAEDVTVTQLSHAAKSRRFVLKFFWMFLCLVGVILTIIQTVQLLQLLLSYPKDTNVLVSCLFLLKANKF